MVTCDHLRGHGVTLHVTVHHVRHVLKSDSTWLPHISSESAAGIIDFSYLEVSDQQTVQSKQGVC